MERWDIHCVKCGKFILTEEKDSPAGNINCVAGSYEAGYYSGKEDVFYCVECAKKQGVMHNEQ